jgi:hypothetical protein
MKKKAEDGNKIKHKGTKAQRKLIQGKMILRNAL